MANNTAKAISIHAPARGATHNGKQTYKIFCNFNPRSREGSDKYRSLSHATDSSFQSTLPRGERQENMIMAEQVIYFNPRSREGSDRSICPCVFQLSLFQSTLPRGERRTADADSTGRMIFQSTLPRGERLQNLRKVRSR